MLSLPLYDPAYQHGAHSIRELPTQQAFEGSLDYFLGRDSQVTAVSLEARNAIQSNSLILEFETCCVTFQLCKLIVLSRTNYLFNQTILLDESYYSKKVGHTLFPSFELPVINKTLRDALVGVDYVNSNRRNSIFLKKLEQYAPICHADLMEEAPEVNCLFLHQNLPAGDSFAFALSVYCESILIEYYLQPVDRNYCN